MEITFKVCGFILMAAIAVLQFFLNILQHPATRWVVLGIALVAAACLVVAEVIGETRKKRERSDWEKHQTERDEQLIASVMSRIAPPTPQQIFSTIPNAPEIEIVSAKSPEITASDPRVYLASIKELASIFPQTLFVATNRGGDVAHKISVQFLFKIKGRNVLFPEVEALPAGESTDILPTIEEESLMSKHDVFRWLLDDWNANAGGLVEDWPKEINVRWLNFKGEKFVCALTFIFHPIDYMLRRNANWPAVNFVVYEFKNMKFSRE